MNGREAVLWIASVCVGVRKSQVKTLGDLVSAAVQIGRVSLSELGRLLAEERNGAAKHGIKRAWRFTANERVHISDAMQGPLRWLFGSRKRWKNHPLLVTFDWTEVRSFHTLMAAAVIDGRDAGRMPGGSQPRLTLLEYGSAARALLSQSGPLFIGGP